MFRAKTAGLNEEHAVFTETHPERDESSDKLSDNVLTLAKLCIEALNFKTNRALSLKIFSLCNFQSESDILLPSLCSAILQVQCY